MQKQKSTRLYEHPFSRDYWRDAAAELKDTKMLVVTALMIALRVALKPLAIPLGPQLSIQTAMLATALGAMIFGPVMAIPAAIISDTIGFILWPTGDYFLPFVLTEIASTMAYALCLYRAKPTTWRTMLSRFIICFFVNVILQQLIFAWQYTYMGNPEKAMDAVLGITGIARIFKNLCMFPVESVVLTAFLGMLMPVVQRAKLVYTTQSDMTFKPKQIIALVCLLAVGVASAVGYLTYRYSADGEGKSRSADYSTEERMEANQAMTQVVLQHTDDWDEKTVVCIVDSAYREMFDDTTDYTLSVYILDEEAFAAGQTAEAEKGKNYDMDTLWAYSKSGPGKDVYKPLIKVATVTLVQTESTGAIADFVAKPVE